MSFWNRKKQINITKSVVNRGLKTAFETFNSNKTEGTLKKLIAELKIADFLVLVDRNGLNYTAGGNNEGTIERGSKLTFLKTVNESGDCLLPVFTDWVEIDLWVESREHIVGWVMSTKEVFEFATNNKSYKGLVINPCSDKWTMTKDELTAFIKENL